MSITIRRIFPELQATGMRQLPTILAVPGERPQSKVKRSVKEVSAETLNLSGCSRR
jgi:hypothetical protein